MRGFVDDDSIDLGVGDQCAEMRAIDIGRQNSDAAGNAVELDQRQRACELARRSDENGAVGQFGKSAAQARAVRQVGDAHLRRAIEEESIRRSVVNIVAQHLRLSVRRFHPELVR